jgi:hypothetical protein
MIILFATLLVIGLTAQAQCVLVEEGFTGDYIQWGKMSAYGNQLAGGGKTTTVTFGTDNDGNVTTTTQTSTWSTTYKAGGLKTTTITTDADTTTTYVNPDGTKSDFTSYTSTETQDYNYDAQGTLVSVTPKDGKFDSWDKATGNHTQGTFSNETYAIGYGQAYLTGRTSTSSTYDAQGTAISTGDTRVETYGNQYIAGNWVTTNSHEVSDTHGVNGDESHLVTDTVYQHDAAGVVTGVTASYDAAASYYDKVLGKDASGNNIVEHQTLVASDSYIHYTSGPRGWYQSEYKTHFSAQGGTVPPNDPSGQMPSAAEMLTYVVDASNGHLYLGGPPNTTGEETLLANYLANDVWNAMVNLAKNNGSNLNATDLNAIKANLQQLVQYICDHAGDYTGAYGNIFNEAGAMKNAVNAAWMAVRGVSTKLIP